MTALIVGNWKMNTLSDSAVALVSALAEASLPSGKAVEIGVCPPFPFLAKVLEAAGSSIRVGAQNCHFESAGAFTGEVSAPMLASLGVHFTLVGHSERRQLFGDSDKVVRKKLGAALAAGLSVIVCLGESLEERDVGSHEDIVAGQARRALVGLSAGELGRLSIAYEPIWAIGTGRTASAAQAAAMHGVVRGVVAEMHGGACAAEMRILYGGSVKPGNAAELLAMEGIDGALVGGASLKSADFLAIIQAAIE